MSTVSPLRLPSPAPATPPERLEYLLVQVARGDREAFERIYERIASPIFGLVRRVLRDPAQSEEVAQEVLVTVWQTASRFDPAKGSAMAWVMTIAHRRAVDRVRAEQCRTERVRRVAHRDIELPYDEVAEEVHLRLERETVRRGLATLTEVQREAITLAYYGGHSYPEVAKLLDIPLGTVKTRIRDGLIRLRDCLGVDQ
ncbi:MAG TPA: sigma-70 family RNA polymerase sigma factor [Sporichthyaceae bacterium]|nr:sigma-70 family RNA polymerase sigma factor [Sporichthyaceae bacterium]